MIVKSRELSLPKRITHDSTNGQIMMLKRGDIIKMGRTILRVSDLRLDSVFDSTENYTGPYQDTHIDFEPNKAIPE